ncbi:hypothetical protein EJV44_08580 [Ancylobacter aquaticus]|nr:hypothetical protein EJV44_08580 [Ancylobacter aquaticus]
MRDIVFSSDPSEDVGDRTALGSLVVLDELNAVVGQHRVDLVGDSDEQSLEETGRDQLRRLPVDPGEDQLGWLRERKLFSEVDPFAPLPTDPDLETPPPQGGPT